ncbi:hypothetical protein BaRGS_00019793 [Batillaria attramentaria]|uniref:Uncharacterized protein n=1 Tax=Batillaria attramentaria TaxID=370345 RepID=A0ABD0KPG3_9CAEN
MGQVINSDGQEMLFESRCPLSVVFPVLCFETVRVRYSSMPSLGANEVMQGTFPRSAEFETSGISCRSASCHLHDTTESSRALLSRDLSECACSSILNAAFDILSCILHLQSDTTEIAKPQCCCQWTCERHPSTGLLGSRLSNESRQSAAAFYSIPQTRPRHCFTLVTFSIAPRQKWTIIYDYAVMTNLLFAFHVIIFLNYINAPRSNPNKNTPGENKYDTNETDREYTAETKEVGFPKHSSPRHSDDNITHVEGSETDTHSSSTVLAVDSISVRPVTLWPERKQEATCCHGISTRADESEEWTPTPSDDEEDILLKLKTLVLDEKTQSHNHGSIVSADFLRQSLQLLIQTTDEHESGQSGQKPHKKPNSDDGLDETDDDEFSFEDFYQASTMRFTPDGRNLIASCVARDMTAELARYGSFDVSRSESARQWLSRLQDAGGVWVLRLAQAGFYRPDENGTTLR